MKNPIQPLEVDENGVTRFKRNAIVRYLLDTHPDCDMNNLAQMSFTKDDRQQFAQLIGYSLGGFSELTDYVDDVAYSTAHQMANGMDEQSARIAALEQKLAEYLEAINGMRASMATLLGMHPDDLRA